MPAPKVHNNVAYYHTYKYDSMQKLAGAGVMHGPRRVITFCVLTAVLPTVLLVIPLYLRHSVFADVTYAVAESDVLEIVDGISPVFCQAQTLRMNTTFHAFQLSRMPERSDRRKHIRLKKSMVLPDDTLEYWGFFLPRGSTVNLTACSRYVGSHILVVKGEKNLRTCGLLDQNKKLVSVAQLANEQVKITFETNAEEIHKFDLHPIHHRIVTTTLKPTTSQSTEAESKRNTHTETSTKATPTQDKINITNFAQFENNNNENDDYLVDDNTAREVDSIEENLDDDDDNNNTDDIAKLEIEALNFLEKHHLLRNGNSSKKSDSESDRSNNTDTRKVRHAKKRNQNDEKLIETSSSEKRKKLEQKKLLEQILNEDVSEKRQRRKRRTDGVIKRGGRNVQMNPAHVLDAGIGHGGNAAVNATDFQDEDEESDVSSFENTLFTCYEGEILLAKKFPSSRNCTGHPMLEKHHKTMETVHEVSSDGYYYYIFYSDNDNVQNDIHVTFDIHKPTYQYTNFTKGCVNETECSFQISFMSSEVVIVEVPTRDGIEHEEDDITLLTSTCEPRMAVYIIFPVSVLFLILGCAFL